MCDQPDSSLNGIQRDPGHTLNSAFLGVALLAGNQQTFRLGECGTMPRTLLSPGDITSLWTLSRGNLLTFLCMQSVNFGSFFRAFTWAMCRMCNQQFNLGSEGRSLSPPRTLHIRKAAALGLGEWHFYYGECQGGAFPPTESERALAITFQVSQIMAFRVLAAQFLLPVGAEKGNALGWVFWGWAFCP